MKNNKFVLSAASIAVSLVLAACGGGGGGTGGNGATAPASGASTPVVQPSGPTTLQTSDPASTYVTGSTQQAAFAQLNAYRLAMGVGALSQDAILDTSAQAHALYLNTNVINGNLSALSHNEVSTFPDYYEVTPLSRARKAGVPATEWVGENVADGLPQSSSTAYASDCLSQFLNTVYHLQAATSVQQTIGIGFQPYTGAGAGIYACVLDFGETAGVSGTPSDNGFDLSGGQQMATTAIAASPYPGETGVARTMTAESPNPAPDLTAPGRPILVQVTAMNEGDTLTVQSFTLTAPDGTVVPSRIILPSTALTGSASTATADVNNLLSQGVAVLLPLAALAANTTYTVTLSAQRNGVAESSKPWTFTTGS